MTMNFTEAKKAVRAMGLTLTKREGEYRVNFKDGAEATAYYTSLLDDAIHTAQCMRNERDAPKQPANSRERCLNVTIIDVQGSPTTTQIWASDRGPVFEYVAREAKRRVAETNPILRRPIIRLFIYDTGTTKLLEYEVDGAAATHATFNEVVGQRTLPGFGV